MTNYDNPSHEDVRKVFGNRPFINDTIECCDYIINLCDSASQLSNASLDDCLEEIVNFANMIKKKMDVIRKDDDV